MDTSLTPKLFKDLFQLEKDYKFNKTLLKIKEEDINRYSITNKTLEESLNASFNEIRELKDKVHHLDESLFISEQKREQEKHICEEVVNRLTMKLNSMQVKHANEVEEGEKEMKRRCKELQNLHESNLNDRDEAHKRAVAEIENNLNRELTANSKLKKELNDVVEQNLVLRNKIRELEAQFVPELTIYKNELRTVRSSNDNLRTEIEFLKNECKRSNAALLRIKNESNPLRNELEQKQAQIAMFMDTLHDYEIKNNQLSEKLQETFKQNTCYIKKCDEDEIERRKLTMEIDELKTYINTMNQNCNVPEHQKCEEHLTQNAMLQEIVKSMRKERQHLLDEEKSAMKETETRIRKLEALIKQLKRVMAPNELSDSSEVT